MWTGGGVRVRGGEGGKYVMRQILQVRGIGTSFVQLAVPRFVVFWDLSVARDSLLSTPASTGRSNRGGGDFIGPAPVQPLIFGGVDTPSSLGCTASLRPYAGVYVQGIWVRAAKIKDTIMCFFGERLDVTGRDRNEVEEERLVEAVVYVLRRCGDVGYLRRLLEPLRGRRAVEGDNDDNNGKGKASKRARGDVASTSSSTSSSWLLQSPRFFNRVVELQKDYILYDVFQIPRGAIFVSNRTTESKDPFVKWAATFLRKNGAPLVPIEKGANRYLFEEVNESELTERCVHILLATSTNSGGRKGKGSDSTDTSSRSFFRKILKSMGVSAHSNVHFHPSVTVAFVHDGDVFVPQVERLTRDLIVRVLNVCNSHLGGVGAEFYSSVVQAVFEILPPAVGVGAGEIGGADAERVVKRAKGIRREMEVFFEG